MIACAVPVRPVYSVDAPVLAALHAPCFPDEPWSAQALATLLESPGAFGLIAYAGAAKPAEALVTALAAPATLARGFILCRIAADEAEVLTLAVAPTGQRLGIGRRLLVGSLSWAASYGVTVMLLEVAEDNLPAQALYADAGFQTVGRRPGYYLRSGQNRVAALVLSRSLLAIPDFGLSLLPS